MSNYYEMAFRGREDAVEFEKATSIIFNKVFGFSTEHIGPKGKTPDILLLSDQAGYQAIIDNKAYHTYSISNDHHNRMVHNYLRNLHNYSSSTYRLGFFSYIAGGFTRNIDTQIRNIRDESKINGSAISINNFIAMIQNHQTRNYSHSQIHDIFSVNRHIITKDLE